MDLTNSNKLAAPVVTPKTKAQDEISSLMCRLNDADTGIRAVRNLLTGDVIDYFTAKSLVRLILAKHEVAVNWNRE